MLHSNSECKLFIYLSKYGDLPNIIIKNKYSIALINKLFLTKSSSVAPVKLPVSINYVESDLTRWVVGLLQGVDPEYDLALNQFYAPYHSLIDVMCRLAINNNCMNEGLVNLSAMVGFEAVPLHLTLFPKLWLDIHQAQNVDRKYITMLTNSSYFADYVESVLLDERLSLNDNIIYNFLVTYFPKVTTKPTRSISK